MSIDGTWVPVEKQTPAWKIFNRLFMCQLSQINTMSTDYLKFFGTPTSGEKDIDRATSNELVTRMLTIEKMAEFHSKGVHIYISNTKDTKEIYEIVTDHLTMWKQKLEMSYHTKDAPVEDLIILDKFATAVYPYAASFFKTFNIESLLARKLSELGRVTRDNVLQPKTQVNENGERKQPAYTPPVRDSLADSFNKFNRDKTKPLIKTFDRHNTEEQNHGMVGLSTKWNK